MGVLSWASNTIGASLGVTVEESDVLRAICKSKAVATSIAEGADIQSVIQSNITQLANIIASTKSAPATSSPSGGGATGVSASVLEEVASMVRLMASDFDGEKLKKYIDTHPVIKSEYEAAATKGDSAAKAYLMGKVPDIAMGYLTGK